MEGNKNEVGMRFDTLIHDYGPVCTVSKSELIKYLGALKNSIVTLKYNEITVARLIGAMAGSSHVTTSDGSGWNIDVFVQVLSEINSQLDWDLVIRSLDYPGFIILDQNGLALIANIYSKATGNKSFPLVCILGRVWRYPVGQLSLIRWALSGPSEIFNFIAICPRNRFVLEESRAHSLTRLSLGGSEGTGSGSLADFFASRNELGSEWYLSPWNSMDLCETLFYIGSISEHKSSVIELFAVSSSPDLVLAALATTKLDWSPLNANLTANFFSNVITSYPNSSLFLLYLWSLNQNLVAFGMSSAWQKDPSCLPRILDMARESKSMAVILDTRPYTFAIDLAALASRRQFLNLEKWLSSRLQELGMPFVKVCLEYLKEKSQSQLDQQQQYLLGLIGKTPVPILPAEVSSVFFKCLQANSSLLSPEDTQELKVLYGACVKMDPKLLAFAQESFPREAFPPDIDRDANAYFQKIYKGVMRMDEVVHLFEKLKNSDNQREIDIFSCMVHNLFDEYRFFPQYPDKELSITGQIFGALINSRLVSNIPLGRALRFVLEALKQNPESKMFNFGLIALNGFQNRLIEWPHYCSNILEIRPLNEINPNLIRKLRQAIQKGGRPTQSGSTFPTRPTPSSGHPKLKSALNVDSLLSSQDEREIEEPQESVKDHIHFIFNNVSESNLKEKVLDLKKKLDPKHYPYLARYLVVKRIVTEVNFHELYISFLDEMNIEELNELITHQSFRLLKTLLISESVTSSSERTLVKNIGKWIGATHLAKNRPILYIDLAVKELLYKAYEEGRLIVILPLVCKILEGTTESVVFRPPNPWTMSLLRVLVEIYHITELKLNLKFEVEVLCKALKIEIADILYQPTLHEYNVDLAKSGDFSIQTDGRGVEKSPLTKSMPISQDITSQIISPTMPSSSSSLSSPSIRPAPATGRTQETKLNGMSLIDLSSYIHINPSIGLFKQAESLIQLIPTAIDRAFREIVYPTINRSITVACTITQTVVLKDFCSVSSAAQLRRASNLMVSNLADSLSFVSSKEALRKSLIYHLRSLLLSKVGEHSGHNIDNISTLIVDDNFDFVTTIVQKTAAEKAMTEIDERLMREYYIRKQFADRDESYSNEKLLNTFNNSLPDGLKRSKDGLSESQISLYEEFFSLSKHLASEPDAIKAGSDKIPSSVDPFVELQRKGQKSSEEQMRAEAQQNSTTLNLSDIALSIQNLLSSDSNSNQQISLENCIEICESILAELNRFSSAVPFNSVSTRFSDREIHYILSLVTILFSRCDNPVVLVNKFTELIWELLWINAKQYDLVNIFVEFLSLCVNRNQNAKLNQSITDNFLRSLKQPPSKLVPYLYAIKSLLLSGLISIQKFDIFLARLIKSSSESDSLTWIHIVMEIINDLVVRKRSIPASEFGYSLKLLHSVNDVATKGDIILSREMLLKLRNLLSVTGEPNIPASQNNMGIIPGRAAKGRKSVSWADGSGSEFRNEVLILFKKCVQLNNVPNQTERNLVQLISQILNKGFLKGDEKSDLFFRELVVFSIDYSFKGSDSSTLDYSGIDAVVKLIVLLVKYLGDKSNIPLKLSLLGKFFEVFVMVFERDSSINGSIFNQKPYFRFILCLLEEFSVKDPVLESICIQVYFTTAQLLNVLKPTRFPQFAFSWLDLISNKLFMPILLKEHSMKGRPIYMTFLVDILTFMAPFLKASELTSSMRTLYSGLLRVMFLLLHDFPDFLCQYYCSFCDVIPVNCVQLMNVVLSAFPTNIKLPDPSTPNMKIDILPEISQSPSILSNYMEIIAKSSIRDLLEDHFKSPSKQSPLLKELEVAFFQPDGMTYNIPLLNAVVLYTGVKGIEFASQKKNSVSLSDSPSMDIFEILALKLNPEGRFLFWNSVANHLRYPNSHTYYFSCVVQYLFIVKRSEPFVAEQITRVLLERLIVNRPHPWGIFITFIELIKNPRYEFWSLPFTRIVPEIEHMFKIVAQSCGAKIPGNLESTASASISAKN